MGAISDYQGNLELTFIDFRMDEAPKYDVEECKARDATYAAPLKVTVRLRNKETEEIKEQEIFMGDFPLMTHSGTFVINGAERVVVSQIVRSPGVYYGKEIDIKTDLPILTSTVIPYRGAWLEYETDANEVFWVRIDKNRKLPITCLIRALGLKTDAEILDRFSDDPRIAATLEKDPCKTYEDAMLEIYRKLRPGEPPTVEAAETLMNNLFFDPRRYDLSVVGRYKFNKKLSLVAAGHRLQAGPARGRPRHRRAALRRGPPAEQGGCPPAGHRRRGRGGHSMVDGRASAGAVQQDVRPRATMWTSILWPSAASRSGSASTCCRSCWASTPARN